jgi:hypothetical protein
MIKGMMDSPCGAEQGLVTVAVGRAFSNVEESICGRPFSPRDRFTGVHS